MPAHKRARGKRKPLDDRLPRQRMEHDIPESEKLCPCGSGQKRPRIGEIVTEQADIVPAKVVVLQHVRFKYGPCRQCKLRVRIKRLKDEGSDASQEEEVLGLLAKNLAQLYSAQATMRRTSWIATKAA